MAAIALRPTSSAKSCGRFLLERCQRNLGSTVQKAAVVREKDCSHGKSKETVMTDSLAVARTSLRFDWSELDEGLLRRLLVAAYEAEGRSEDVLLLRSQSHGSLVKQAQRSLGRPPNVRYMDSMSTSYVTTGCQRSTETNWTGSSGTSSWH